MNFLPVIIAWLAGLLLAYHPMILSGLVYLQTDLGDTRLNNYILEHSFLWITRTVGHLNFWDPPLFYQLQNGAAYTEIHLGTAPFYWVWRMLGMAPFTAFQFWMFTVSSLNFWAAWLWLHRGLRSLQINSFAAATGAFLFAFASSRVVQTGHQQLIAHFYTIIAFYALTRIFEGGLSRLSIPAWIGVFFASVTAQLYAGFYLGWFLTFALGVGLLWALLCARYRRSLVAVIRSHYLAILISGALSGLALSWMMTHYLEAGKEVGYRPYESIQDLIPTPQSWLYLGNRSWLYSWQPRIKAFAVIAMQPEQCIGLGLITSACIAAGLVRARKNSGVRLIILSALVIFFCVTLFPPKVTLWKTLFHVIPGAKAIRGLSRVGLLMLVPASLGLALFFNDRKRMATVAMLGILVAIEQGQTTSKFNKYENLAQIELIVQRIKTEYPDCQAFYFSPILRPGMDTPSWKYQLDAMWAGAHVNLPTINGHSGNSPLGWELLENRIKTPADELSLSQRLNHWVQFKHLNASTVCWVKMPVES
jgi:hypothetical protein